MLQFIVSDKMDMLIEENSLESQSLEVFSIKINEKFPKIQPLPRRDRRSGSAAMDISDSD